MLNKFLGSRRLRRCSAGACGTRRAALEKIIASHFCCTNFSDLGACGAEILVYSACGAAPQVPAAPGGQRNRDFNIYAFEKSAFVHFRDNLTRRSHNAEARINTKQTNTKQTKKNQQDKKGHLPPSKTGQNWPFSTLCGCRSTTARPGDNRTALKMASFVAISFFLNFFSMQPLNSFVFQRN